MSRPGERFEAVVVGGGMGGLSAALSLARDGRKVLVLEKNASAGGNCTARKMGDYTFDLAVHQLTGVDGDGQCGGILKDYGVRDRLDFARIDPFLVLDYPDRSYQLPGTWEGVRAALHGYFPESRAAIDRLMKKLEHLKQDTVIAQRVMYGDNPVVRELLEKGVPSSRWLAFPFGGLSLLSTGEKHAEALFRDYLKDDKLFAVVCGSWPYLGVPPSQLSAMMMALLFSGQHMEKTFYPRGSSQRVADTFVEAITAHGGEVRCEAPVKRIIIERGRATGVELEDGARIDAGYVVCNAPAPYVYGSLIDAEHVPPAFTRRLQSMKKSLGPFKVYLGLDYDVSAHGLGSHEYLLYNTYDHEETYRQMCAGVPAALSAYAPTQADPSLAPPGHSTVILTTMFPWQTTRDWRTHADDVAEEMIDLLERRVPDVRAHIVEQHTLTPEKLRQFTNASEGAMYGWANTRDQVLIKRLPNASPIGGLFHVGHWSQPGTGVTTAIISGWMVGNQLRRRYPAQPRRAS